MREAPVRPADEKALKAVFNCLLAATGVDFSQHRRATVLRRVRRRMASSGAARLEDYLRLLQREAGEVEALFEALLVNPASFFKDPRAFEILKEGVYPRMLELRSGRAPIRVWVPGCSTGEEAYSHAMSLVEYLEARSLRVPIQVFATDVSESILARARAGLYLEAAAKDLAPERLKRFFAKEGDGYRVNQAIRDVCVFARHNVAVDPPISNIDLISCRDVLLFLSPRAQGRVLSLLHYALKPEAFLMLGSAEALGDLAAKFSLVDRRGSVYRKTPGPSGLPLRFLGSRGDIRTAIIAEGARPPRPPAPQVDCQAELRRILIEQYAPAGVMVDSALNVLHSHGSTGQFLELPPGEASLNLAKLLRGDISLPVQAAIRQARRRASTVTTRIYAPVDGREGEIQVDVVPIRSSAGGERQLVLFKGLPLDRAGLARGGAGTQRLRRELAAAREQLRAAAREQELSGQELKSVHEAAVSANQELKSINEQLATAQDQLQAGNEELLALNDELSRRNADLAAAGNDMSNLLASVRVPIIMLGSDLRIRRFTPAAAKAFGLENEDVGRPLFNGKLRLEGGQLGALLSQAVSGAAIGEFEARDQNGRWYSIWLRPYRTEKGGIEGAVLCLLDVTEKRSAAAALKESKDYAEAIVDSVKESLAVVDPELKIKRANRTFYETFKLRPEAVKGRSIFEIAGGLWNTPALRDYLETLLDGGEGFSDWESDFEVPGAGRRTLALSGRLVPREPGRERNILLVIEDVSVRKQAAEAEALRRNDARQREFLANVTHELMTPITAIKGYAEALISGALDIPKQRLQFTQIIERHAERLSHLVEDLLELSALDSARKKSKVEVVALRPFVQRFIMSMALVLRRRRIKVVVRIPRDLEARIDKVQLTQVLHNLCGNAAKYSRARGRIDIEARVERRKVVVSVKDTGIGVSKEDLALIFDRFHRANNARAEKIQGTGLGLSIVKSILESHGCKIWAESALGKGSTFHFTLPLA